MMLTTSQAVDILRAAGEPTRLRILALLAGEELAVLELCRVLDQSQPRVSRHLKLLAEAGLVERFPDGAWVFYRLVTSGDAIVVDYTQAEEGTFATTPIPTTTVAVQRSADCVSVGPMLQGLRKPVNDLSRGALVDDIVYTIALTAIQAANLPGKTS